MTRADVEGRLIDLPVQYVNGKWEVIFGGEVPVREGTYATLRIRERAIEDSSFRNAIDQEIVVKVLDEGTVLHAALSSFGGTKPDKQRVLLSMDSRYWPGERLSFVPIRLGPPSRHSFCMDQQRGGLWMRHTGFDKCELVTSEVYVFEEGDAEGDSKPFIAESLNHAFTVLSERYEHHRISHTGSVYDRFFYEERSGDWFPLASLRDGVRERSTQAVVAAAWEQIEQVIGWCRLPPVPKKKEAKPKRRGQLFGPEWEDDTRGPT